MDFTLSEEQEAVRDLARQIMTGRGPTDPDSGYPPSWPDTATWSTLADAGLLGIAIPESHGGGGQGMTELSLLLAELGREVACVPAWSTLAIVGPALAMHGSESQQQAWLPGLAAGTARVSCALTEPQQVDPRAPHTTAKPDGEGLRLDGEKVAVPLTDDVTHVLVSATTPAGEPVLALVSTDAAGVAMTPQALTDGQPVAGMRLDGVEVAAEDVVVRGAEAFGSVIDSAQVGRAALQLGVAEKALEMTAAYVSQREQFGVPIGTFQSVACRVADCYIDVQSMRSTLQQATWRIDSGLPAREEVAVAAFWAADGARRVLAASVHLHGGIGVDTDYPLHHYFVRAKHLEVLLGSATASLVGLGEVLAERTEGAAA